ncbi:hypothetical protein [Botrimarina mediterranea]|uniref:hypothetical protein n=1 Tax=Botrimarina mediterranea TaxID=2528022 RepID=UPI00118B5756|nr:hypothetical protein K2D_47130 [Planctomycetes bacterium K2D]
MSENASKPKGLFEAFLGVEQEAKGSFAVSTEFPPRLSFEKWRDGESLSVPYNSITRIRYYVTILDVYVGEHRVRITGGRLLKLYKALHRQEVSRVIEQPPEGAFGGDAEGEEALDPSEPQVESIDWPSEILPA